VSSPRSLARRYARALLEVAASEGRAAALALRDELRGFVPQLLAHPQLQQALAHPALGAEPKRRLVLALADAAKLSPLARRLVDLLGARGRLWLLPDVAAAYAELANAAHGVVAAAVVSAAPLADAQKQGLARALAGAGQEVELAARVDPALLGGVVVRAHGRTYDGSVRTRLEALRQRLAAG
jgi:F-type H+-transporting ATPase subunit delta